MHYNNTPPTELRRLIRAKVIAGQTAGMSAGYLQANVVILPASNALDFFRYCQRNPKPCPIVGVSDTGSSSFPLLAEDMDIRTDIPKYNVFRNGELEQQLLSIEELWQHDFVTFALGCSHTFEDALVEAGFDIWHLKNGATVPMFKTSIQTVPCGPFHGPMVVTMRAIPENRLAEAVEICKQFPLAHGAPVHIGEASQIGIADLASPDWGDAAPVPDGCIPVFWACGVTPQMALLNAKIPLSVTHTPGCMLVTDISDRSEIPVLGQSFPLDHYLP